MDFVLSRLLNTFVVYTGVELGNSTATPYLCSRLMRLVTFCKQADLGNCRGDILCDWNIETYVNTLDLDTFFDYFQPEYDLGVISEPDYNTAMAFIYLLTRQKVPLILSRHNLGSRRGYTLRTFEKDDQKCYLYYQDHVDNWKFA